jgi:hypothetical protein
MSFRKEEKSSFLMKNGKNILEEESGEILSGGHSEWTSQQKAGASLRNSNGVL